MTSRPYGPSHLLAWLQFFILLLGISNGALAAEPRTIVVGSAGLRPVAFLESGDRWAGLSVTALDAVAAQEGWKISRVTAPWSALLSKLENGEIDILEGITHTANREKRFEFSNESLMNNWAVIYAPVGTSISSLPDLDGKTVAVSERSAHTKALNSLAKEFGVKFTSAAVPGFVRVFDLLSNGEADAGLVSRTFGIGQGEKFGLLPTPVVLDPSEIRYAAPKGTNRDILKAIDRYLVAAKADPASAYNRALKQWVGGRSKTEIPNWLVVTVLVTVISLIIAVVSAVILRRQVKKRTVELGASEKRFRAVFEDAPLGVALWAKDGTLVDANPALSTMFGIDHDEIIGESIQSLTARHDLGRSMEHFQALISGESNTVQFEKQYLRKNGEPFTARISSSVVHDQAGDFLFAMGMIENITERKRMEDALRLTQFTLDHGGDAAFWVGENGIFEYVNKSGQRMLGYSWDELSAMHIWDVDPDVTQADWPRIWTRIASRGERHTFEAVHLAKDGSKIPVEVTITQVNFDDRTIVCSFSRDITERKQTEDQLRQAQKMEAVGQLTGGIAHDFNNLLSVILGNAELLKDRIPADRGLVEKIERAASRGAELTHRLLAFSRRQPLQRKVTDVNLLIADMLDLLKRTLGETISIKIEKCANPWNVEIDPAQLESAVLNIAINARDAMPRGGTLKIETANVALDKSDVAGHDGCSPGDYFRLAMTDTGVGMSPEVLEHAIEPFFTTKDVGEGSGLGLSMIYGFVKQSGGFVGIDSEPGHGSAVRLYLRRAMVQAGAVTANDTGLMRPGQLGGTVLVVEDDPDVRELVIRLLGDLGCATVEAEDGRMALARLEDNPDIDLLFTDVVLPHGMSGPEMAREARRHRPNLKIVFTSGYPDKEIRDPAWEGERPQIVSKPYTRAELAEALSNATKPPSLPDKSGQRVKFRAPYTKGP